MIVDAHCHVFDRRGWSETIARRYLEAGLAETPTWWDPSRTWTLEDQLADPDRLVAAMDDAGVDRAVIFGFLARPYDCFTPPELIRDAVDRHPERLVPFHVIDPLGGREARQAFERAITHLGFRGAKLLPVYNHMALDDARLYPFYALAEDLRVPLVVHTGATRLAECRLEWQEPQLLDDVGAAFPELVLWHAHAGLYRWPSTFAVLGRFPRMVADLSFWGKYPASMAAEAMTHAKRLGLIGRLMWGTDYPFWGPSSELQRWRAIPDVQRRMGLEPVLTDDDLAAILGENAVRLVGAPR